VIPTGKFLSARTGGVLLSVKLQPRAAVNEIGSPLGDELKIKVTAPPVDAAANEALVELLAEKLDCARNRVELIRGHTSRLKTIMLHGFKPADVYQKLSGGVIHLPPYAPGIRSASSSAG
jgi:uncharacterized protein (TIGR00251 family)